MRCQQDVGLGARRVPRTTSLRLAKSFVLRGIFSPNQPGSGFFSSYGVFSINKGLRWPPKSLKSGLIRSGAPTLQTHQACRCTHREICEAGHGSGCKLGRQTGPRNRERGSQQPMRPRVSSLLNARLYSWMCQRWI